MTRRMLLLVGLAAVVACAKAAELPAEQDAGTSGSGDPRGEAGRVDGATGGTATGGKEAAPEATGGKDEQEAAGGTGSGTEPPDETGGTGQTTTQTGGAPPAGGTNDALYGKLELTYESSGNTQFAVSLKNLSGKDLNTAGLEIRYWFTPEGAISDAVCECYNVQVSITTCNDVTRTFVEGPPAYLQITFDVPDTFTFWGSSDEVSEIKSLQIAIHRQDYQNDDMTNDYSYQATSGANDKITVYYKGKLVWGVEPEA